MLTANCLNGTGGWQETHFARSHLRRSSPWWHTAQHHSFSQNPASFAVTPAKGPRQLAQWQCSLPAPAPTGQLGSGQQAGAAATAAAPAQAAIAFQQEPQLHVELGQESMPLGDQSEAGSRVLEAVLRGNQWELVCHSSGLHQWTDQVPAKVVAVAGSLHFAAAALESAVLQVRSNTP